jgi:ParB family chromosome partitioning protein
MSLLKQPEPIQAQVKEGKLAATVAYEIGKLEDPAEQAELAARVVSEGLNRAETVEAVRERKTSGKPKGRGVAKGRKETSRVIRKAAGCTVTVENGRGLDDDLVISALKSALEQSEARRNGQVAA